jgi:hypothetical protein
VVVAEFLRHAVGAATECGSVRVVPSRRAVVVT